MLSRILIVLAALGALAVTAPASERYAEADAHADAIPARSERSIDSIADYLARVGRDDEIRARALYRWITTNIEYDTVGFVTGNYGSMDPADVLAKGSSVCSGYAGLFKAIGTRMGLEIEVINGWSKGYGYRAGAQLPRETNHAWNAVRVNGQWRLVDSTWGAGYVTGNPLRFEYRFVNHYFLTEPAQFIFDHLPDDPEWQLLDEPISADRYLNLAYLRPGFFTSGLEIDSHRNSRIDAGSRVTVGLRGQSDTEVSARLETTNGETIERAVLIERTGSSFAINVVAPQAGEYLLRVFAKRADDPGYGEWAMDYGISASRGTSDRFPMAFTEFTNRSVGLQSPARSPLRAGEVEFDLTVPGARDVAVTQGSNWTHLEPRGDRFVAVADLEPGIARVFASFPDIDNYAALLEFEVE